MTFVCRITDICHWKKLKAHCNWNPWLPWIILEMQKTLKIVEVQFPPKVEWYSINKTTINSSFKSSYFSNNVQTGNREAKSYIVKTSTAKRQWAITTSKEEKNACSFSLKLHWASYTALNLPGYCLWTLLKEQLQRSTDTCILHIYSFPRFVV